MTVDVIFDDSWQEEFLKRMDDDGPWAKWELYKLAYTIEQQLRIESFDGMIAPKFLPNLKPLPHQLEAATKVIEEMNGKAILADEVGLGKTIEAGLILKEYMIRGLVKKVLILVPASLISQWTQELNEKFYIPAVPQRKTYVWEQCDVVISSIDTAKRSPHREIIYQQEYDMVIIDEAHRLKNNKTKNYEFAQRLKKKFCLLLTATPVQNNVEEIFNLVSLLKPGHLGNQSNFAQIYQGKRRSINNDDYLKELVNKVMVRNRRSDTNLNWPKRIVKTVPITFTKEERELYDYITSLKTQLLGRSSFSILTLQREACSSKEATYLTLQKLFAEEAQEHSIYKECLEKLNQIKTNSKAEKALQIIQQIEGKVIIFTEYRATQLYLQWFLQQHGISSVPFRGGFKRSKKDWMRQLFKDHAKVLIATEAGGEGINLQFCQHIINYDLPWNPMRIEQRIGRIHRLGQEGDVHIYNFSVKDTVEEHILQLLYEKIHLFERVVGDLDEILAKVDVNLEKHIEDIFLHSESKGEIKIKLDNLTSLINFTNEANKESDNAATGNS